MAFIESFGSLATAKGLSGNASRGGGYSAEMTFQDYDAMARSLNKLDKELLKEIRKQYREIASGPQKAVKKSIPSGPPIRGMRKAVIPGRLTWGTVKPARSVLVKATRPKKLSDKKAVPIVQLVVGSPATIMADMSGRGKSTGAKQVTPVYAYSRSKSGYRVHRINGQGQAMVDALGGKGSASRYVYPAVEDSMDEVRFELEDVIASANLKVQRELDRVDGA